MNKIKILYYNFQNDYTFSNQFELDKIIKDIKNINNLSIYLPIIKIIGQNFILHFNLNSISEYQKMENKLKKIYNFN